MIDVIELKLEVKSFNPPYEVFADQEILVNGEKFEGFCDILTFLEDAHRRVRYDPERSWSYLNSCGCGHAGCSGIWEGVHIRKKKGLYYYSARKRGGYRKGILGSGKLRLRVSEENILAIRRYIVEFYTENKETLKDERDEENILIFLGVLAEE